MFENSLTGISLGAADEYGVITISSFSPDPYNTNLTGSTTQEKRNYTKILMQDILVQDNTTPKKINAGIVIPGFTKQSPIDRESVFIGTEDVYIFDGRVKTTYTKTELENNGFYIYTNPGIAITIDTWNEKLLLQEQANGDFIVQSPSPYNRFPQKTIMAGDIFRYNGITFATGSIGGVLTQPDEEYPFMPICFLAGTPIQTNQGLIAIDNIDPNVHTIRGKTIQAITQTKTPDDSLICFEANSLGENWPSKKTVISMNHKIFYQGKMTKAKCFVGNHGIYKIPYKKQVLYNVLLDTHDKMVVNNMICETLDPRNTIAQLYMKLKSIPKDKHASIISQFNEFCLEQNICGSDKTRKSNRKGAVLKLDM